MKFKIQTTSNNYLANLHGCKVMLLLCKIYSMCLNKEFIIMYNPVFCVKLGGTLKNV